MYALITGLLLWSLVHLVPALAPRLKQRWIAALGPGGYKGSFSFLIIAALTLIIYGWRHTVPVFLYQLPVLMVPFAYALILAGFVLLVNASRASRVRRIIRHPQLTGVALWACAHLLLNGDVRSLVLFGGLASWAAVEMIAINHRDGSWQKPAAPGWQQELLGLAIALGVFAAAFFAHPHYTGARLY